MGFTNFPNGVTSFGSPLPGGGRFSSPWATHYFVDGDDGDDGNPGLSPTSALKTIQKAIDLSTGGDVIYIRPKSYKLGTGFTRYTEDVVVAQSGTGSATTEVNANKSLIGVTQRGHATDFLGVRWKYATDTNLNIESPGTHVENIGFFTEGATDGIFIETDGATRSKGGTDGSSIYNCAIKGEGKIRSNGSNEIIIMNCRFQTKFDGTVGGINMVGSANAVVRPLIQNCEFIGGNANNMSAACIIGAAPWQDAIVRDCYFNADPDTNVYISIAGSTSTGIIANCYFGVADLSTTRIVQGGMVPVGCYDSQGIQVDA